MIKCNFHTHTDYCDGKDSVEEIINSALDKGFTALGFSGHSYLEPDKSFAMTAEIAQSYRREILSAKEKYRGKIEILCGIEQDYFSLEPTKQYDYIIGSVHYVFKNGEYISVDDTAEIVKNAVQKHYGGDYDALAEDYFALVADVVNKTNADIIGHLDLISKFSEKNGYGQSERFLKAAERAVESLVKYNKPFEINTGAMAKGLRNIPYPSPEILKIIKEKGGKIMLSSDCHDKNNLDFAFDTVARLAKSAGFTKQTVFLGGKVTEIDL